MRRYRRGCKSAAAAAAAYGDLHATIPRITERSYHPADVYDIIQFKFNTVAEFKGFSTRCGPPPPLILLMVCGLCLYIPLRRRPRLPTYQPIYLVFDVNRARTPADIHPIYALDIT